MISGTYRQAVERAKQNAKASGENWAVFPLLGLWHVERLSGFEKTSSLAEVYDQNGKRVQRSIKNSPFSV